MKTRTLPIFVLLALGMLATSCGSDRGAEPKTVTLLAYDSFLTSEGIFDSFTASTGYEVNVVTGGDAGELLAKAAVTAGNPEGDVLWGIDNTLLTRAVRDEVFEPYASPAAEMIDADLRTLAPNDLVTPVDTGDVCLNVDTAWFSNHSITPPAELADLVKPAYKGLTVVPSAITSSTGLAFLLGSIIEFGDQWTQWWSDLLANDALIVDGWTRAYTVEFSGSSGAGKYPIVVSYGTSPPAEVLYSDPPVEEPRTRAIESGCFHQVEFAGILRGTENRDGAEALIDFLVGEEFQSDIPLNMFVFPVNSNVALPDLFEKFAIRPDSPLKMEPSRIAENRDAWLEQWLKIVD